MHMSTCQNDVPRWQIYTSGGIDAWYPRNGTPRDVSLRKATKIYTNCRGRLRSAPVPLSQRLREQQKNCRCRLCRGEAVHLPPNRSASMGVPSKSSKLLVVIYQLGIRSIGAQPRTQMAMASSILVNLHSIQLRNDMENSGDFDLRIT